MYGKKHTHFLLVIRSIILIVATLQCLPIFGYTNAVTALLLGVIVFPRA